MRELVDFFPFTPEDVKSTNSFTHASVFIYGFALHNWTMMLIICKGMMLIISLSLFCEVPFISNKASVCHGFDYDLVESTPPPGGSNIFYSKPMLDSGKSVDDS